MPGTSFCKRARRADEHRKRAEVHGDDSFRLQQVAGIRGFARPHRVVIADRQQGEVGCVELADNPHIAEHIGIPGMINLQPGGKFDHVATGFPAINQLVAVLNAAGVIGMDHGDFDVIQGLRAALVHLRQFLDALSFPATRTTQECQPPRG